MAQSQNISERKTNKRITHLQANRRKREQLLRLRWTTKSSPLRVRTSGSPAAAASPESASHPDTSAAAPAFVRAERSRCHVRDERFATPPHAAFLAGLRANHDHSQEASVRACEQVAERLHVGAAGHEE